MIVAPSKKLETFFAQFKLLFYKKGEAILRPDDLPPGVFYLKKGYVKLYSLCREGEELSLILFKPGDFFPIGWVINNKIDPYYLDAMTPVEVWRAPREKFLEFIKADPDVFFELTSKMLMRLGGLLQRMEHLVFGNAGDKVASILVICALRFGEKEEKGIVIQVPLFHKEIGALVGLTRETVSLEMKKLEKENIIDYQGRLIIVKNFKKLEEESLLNNSS